MGGSFVIFEEEGSRAGFGHHLRDGLTHVGIRFGLLWRGSAAGEGERGDESAKGPDRGEGMVSMHGNRISAIATRNLTSNSQLQVGEELGFGVHDRFVDLGGFGGEAGDAHEIAFATGGEGSLADLGEFLAEAFNLFGSDL